MISLAPSLACALIHSVGTACGAAQPAAFHGDSLHSTWSILVLGEAEKIAIGNSNHESGKGAVAPCTTVPGQV